MSLKFDHTTLRQRILFGTGQAAENLAAETNRRNARRVMVIASARDQTLVSKVSDAIEVALLHDDVAPHVPITNAERARTEAIENAIDLVVCIGGGSTTGLAKAVALTTGLPIVAVPTTYAGSEATNVWGMTESERKSTGVDDRVLPGTVIYDAELTMSLPTELSISSGINALAHCVDSMWAPRTDPINQVFALEGIRTLSSGLLAIKTDPSGITGREQALYGAYLAAVAFASAGSGLHHKICHALGGAYGMPHAQTHAVVLPHVLAFNAAAAPDAERRIAAALEAPTARDGLSKLRRALDAPRSLKDYGLDEKNIPEAVQIILPLVPDSNPRPVTASNLETLLRAAHSGSE